MLVNVVLTLGVWPRVCLPAAPSAPCTRTILAAAPVTLGGVQMTTITNLSVRDIRFPTSRSLDGSDAMNAAPDYSATYVVLETDSPEQMAGHGLTFTDPAGVTKSS